MMDTFYYYSNKKKKKTIISVDYQKKRDKL